MAAALLQDIELRRLAGTAADARVVQDIYARTPTYHLLVHGKLAAPGEANRTFKMLPEGCKPDSKHMYLITETDAPVGFVDVIRGFPNDHTAYVGLFIVSEARQRAGIGRSAYAALEQRAARWPEITRLRLSVVRSNRAALAFWTAMGFQPTGERGYDSAGAAKTEHLLFEKQLEAST